MLDYFSRKHSSEIFGSGFFLGPVLDYFSRKHISELFGSGFFLGPVLDYFSRKHISEISGSGFFLGPVLDYFLGNIVLRFLTVFFLVASARNFWQWVFSGPVLDYFSRKHISEIFSGTSARLFV